jgi:hypothetical protein
MEAKPMSVMTTETVERQRQYVEAQNAKGHGLGVVFADAFLRGMRDIGYKNPAWAFAELIDNSIQAAAETVSVRFGFDPENTSQAKPDQVAISDDGNGMIPEMISFAVRWGGTDREGDRHGLGRYGYGLPSSVVSLAKRYTVYSKTEENGWYAVTVDIDVLSAVAGDIQKTEELLTARPAQLPEWLLEEEERLDLAQIKSGTVVVLEELDRLRSLTGWITVNVLTPKLLQHFGVIYRHWVPGHRIYVHGNQVDAVDPLFLMEHARFFDETSVRAIRVETRSFEVETPRGTMGAVRIRASVLPPNFQLADPDADLERGKKNKRFETMKEFNGLLICRERRQIDCISPRWTTFGNYDRNIKIEVDFSPELDEFFGITTAKQQIVIADEMWEKLQHSGRGGGALIDLVEDMRHRREGLREQLKAMVQNKEHKDEPRASAVAMEETEKFKGVIPSPTPNQLEEAEGNLEEAAKKRADATGETMDEALNKLLEETSRRRWEVEFAAILEGPFYRPMRFGEQKRLIINTDHPFYSKVYDITPDVRAALEVLMFVLAERELESRGDAETFYKAERNLWSERLRKALDQLVPDDALVNKAAAVAEHMHVNEGR